MDAGQYITAKAHPDFSQTSSKSGKFDKIIQYYETISSIFRNGGSLGWKFVMSNKFLKGNPQAPSHVWLNVAHM